MSPETKVCQNCKKDFKIESNDFSFYQKIKVPPPTFCPECRYIRRLLDRNEHNLYKRKCDATGENIISIYRSDAPFPVYKQEYWKSDSFDAKKYGRDFDFSKPFFEQYEELRRVVPHLALINSNSVNSEYTNQSDSNKDCYMLVTSDKCEKCMYGNWNQKSFMCSDCSMIEGSEFCYECININNCSNCAWSYDCSNCVSVYFSRDCRGCTDCFGCVGLRNQQYCWFNENFGKEKYQEKLKEFNLKNNSVDEIKEEFLKFQSKIPTKYYHGSQIKNSTGDYIENSENMKESFNCRDNKDTSYMQDAWNKTVDSMDCTEVILSEMSYEIQGVASPHKTIVARSCMGFITNSFYCDMCLGIQDCLGCFGLKKNQYCILNKQYSKEEYLVLKEKIIDHMKKYNEWGEYFPAKYSPFTYNESMAQDYFPLTKEEAIKNGHSWYDRPSSNYNVTLESYGLPNINEIGDKILNKVIRCKSQYVKNAKEYYPECATAFKITQLELALYIKINIPIPEYCFVCRQTNRFKLRNSRKLWHRKCMKEGCINEFETSYSPDRPEIIYCESCYQKEVY